MHRSVFGGNIEFLDNRIDKTYTDQKAGKFIFRNSWGKRWGRDGYGTIPFKYVETLADDFWTIRR